MCVQCGQSCDDCGQWFIHREHPLRPGVIMASTCGCQYEITVVDGTHVWKKIAPPCRHDSIFFGSGGHYIFCHSCRATWCARPAGDGAMDEETYRAAQSNICQTGPGANEGTRKL